MDKQRTIQPPHTLTEENPYSAPQPEVIDSLATQNVDKLHIKPIFKAWEKLRIYYNLALLVVGIIVLLILISRYHMTLSFALVQALLIGVLANIFYFLGPATEAMFCIFLRKPELPLYRKFSYTTGFTGSLALFAIAATYWIMPFTGSRVFPF